jgi:predicted RNA-binding Zn-ribbon protein involved in translation (DUF1610 family)
MTEAERYRAAWKARRQRSTIRLLIMAAMVAIMTIPPHPVWVWAVSLTGMLYAEYWFNQFRCPRCGEIFNPDWKREVGPFSGKLLRCDHCGLELDEIPGEKQT